ncbi:S41 family peptidase [Macrococcus equipercicus]|uniref:Probable CtpA-like serine protease n=2 Tax=Macrococcus equipercicus TaxID=69967 RepID=A0A9Q9F0D2_9STAP|nr:S41 family peptidase [Macrococcus equipercicus]KAA1040232.1 S41 family peptidase [Macrococcus equipercicus]UTH12823.1 S41 family peptidase [Macrococcus equipercicus]
MLLLTAVILTAGITAFATTTGSSKVISQQTPKRTEFLKLYEVYDTLNSQYYKNVNKEKLIDSAIKGMVNGLDDPYSEYMTKSEQQEFTDSMSGDFQGIGAEMGEEGSKIIITSPIKGAPADKAGIKANDEIVEIDGKSTKGMNSVDVVKKIRGKKGTTVTLLIKRGVSTPFKVAIKRDTVHVNSVETKMLNNKVALITVTKFQQGTAAEFNAALKDMHEQGMKKLILDFRNNPGGYLDEASKMANEFIGKGEVLFYTENNHSKPQAYKAENPADPVTKNLPTVIIMNEGSASASEVFAASLHDHDKAYIVGTKSFGKGIVQTAAPFKDDSMLKFTQMKWLTPDKTWIHKKGITPDKLINLPDYANIHILDPDEVYVKGESSAEVKSLETGLKALGYNPGAVDKTFDENTALSVAQFQQKEGLEVTGQMTGKSTLKFTELLRNKLNADDTQLNGAVSYISTLK